MKGMLLMFFGLLSCCIHAQEAGLSFRAGGSMAVQSPELFRPDRFSSSKHAIVSPYCGFEYEYPLNRVYAYASGLQYLDKGFKASYVFNAPGFSSSTSYRYELRYLEMPLEFRYRADKWSAHAGIIFSLLISNVYDFEESDQYGTNLRELRYSVALRTRYRTCDVGLCIGLARRISPCFELEIQIERGFIKPDTWMADELVFQEAGLIGLKYYFLKHSSFLADSRSETALQH